MDQTSWSASGRPARGEHRVGDLPDDLRLLLGPRRRRFRFETSVYIAAFALDEERDTLVPVVVHPRRGTVIPEKPAVVVEGLERLRRCSWRASIFGQPTAAETRRGMEPIGGGGGPSPTHHDPNHLLTASSTLLSFLAASSKLREGLRDLDLVLVEEVFR